MPGAFELPYAAARLQSSCTVVLCIGCLIKGETMHFEYISEAVAQGIMRLNAPVLQSGEWGEMLALARSPVIFGVLECLTEDQALARAGLIAGSHNHGTEWAQSALRMAEIGTGGSVMRPPVCLGPAQFRASAAAARSGAGQ